VNAAPAKNGVQQALRLRLRTDHDLVVQPSELGVARPPALPQHRLQDGVWVDPPLLDRTVPKVPSSRVSLASEEIDQRPLTRRDR
jgi:hypothetical protein